MTSNIVSGRKRLIREEKKPLSASLSVTKARFAR
jgi:hypothetical protein